jgi:hypothetical protein
LLKCLKEAKYTVTDKGLVHTFVLSRKEQQMFSFFSSRVRLTVVNVLLVLMLVGASVGVAYSNAYAYPDGTNCYRGDRKLFWKDGTGGTGWHHIIEFDVNRSGAYYVAEKPWAVWSASVWPGYYNGYHIWVAYNAVTSPWSFPDYIFSPSSFKICLH